MAAGSPLDEDSIGTSRVSNVGRTHLAPRGRWPLPRRLPKA